MNWKQLLDEYAKHKDWRTAISLLERVADENPDDEVEASVRLIYLLHNLLLEEDYKKAGFDHDYLADSLLRHFQTSYYKFKDDAEYLFFLGIIMHIAEWYFGQKDTSLALEMQKKATELDPENALYAFSYSFSTADKTRTLELAQQLSSDNKTIQWLRSKGFPGSYVERLIDNSLHAK